MRLRRAAGRLGPAAIAQRDAAAVVPGLAAVLAALAAGSGDKRLHFIILEHSMILHLIKTDCFMVHMLSQCRNGLSMPLPGSWIKSQAG